MTKNLFEIRHAAFAIISAIILSSALSVSIFLNVSEYFSIKRIEAVTDGKLAPLSHAQNLLAQSIVRHPSEWIATARALSVDDPDQVQIAISLLDRALTDAPTEYDAWTLLAFLEHKRSDAYTDRVEASLQRSIDTCPYCSKSILRWRFTFVLDNWEQTSEDIRLAAFSGADFLRWWHLDYEYLNQVRTDALARNIPFDAYRQKIPTPVRPNEVGITDR